MADNAVFSSSKGGIPSWLIIGGVGVGAIAIVMLATKNSGGGTTAAGASINAGLGSLQEEQMNLLGTVQAGAAANNANFSSLSGQLQDVQTSILGAISDQGTLTGQQIQNAVDNVNQNTNADNQSVMSGLADALSKILSGQQQITSTVESQSQTIQGEIGGVASNIAQNQNQLIQQLNLLQQGETQIINTVGPKLDALMQAANNIQDLQKKLATAQYNHDTDLAAQLSAQISDLQSQVASNQTDIMNTIGQFQSQNAAALNGLTGQMSTMYQGISSQFYDMEYAIANVGYHVGAAPNPA